MMKTNSSLLILLGREDGERHWSQHTGEDMYAVPCNFIFYEMVHKGTSTFTSNILHSSSTTFPSK
jgi:hypothetical protein